MSKILRTIYAARVMGLLALLVLLISLFKTNAFTISLFVALLGAHFLVKGFVIFKTKAVSDIFYSLQGKRAQIEGVIMMAFGAILLLLSILGLIFP